MAAFFYLNKVTRKYMVATNLKSIQEFSTISYGKLDSRLRNNRAEDGDSFYEDDDMILLKTEIVKGKQRVKSINGVFVKNDRGIEQVPRKVFKDMFDEI